MNAMPTKHLLIEGKVQGVFFRASAKERAERLQLTGWVKNTPVGNVEVVVSGAEENIATFVEWCKSGPERAKVTGITVRDVEEGTFPGFRIIRD